MNSQNFVDFAADIMLRAKLGESPNVTELAVLHVMNESSKLSFAFQRVPADLRDEAMAFINDYLENGSQSESAMAFKMVAEKKENA